MFEVWHLNRPPAHAIFIVLMYDLIIYNPAFRVECSDPNSPMTLNTFISAASYLLAHAWSPVSKRASTYGRIALNVLLAFVEDPQVSERLSTGTASLHICRQVGDIFHTRTSSETGYSASTRFTPIGCSTVPYLWRLGLWHPLYPA